MTGPLRHIPYNENNTGQYATNKLLSGH